MKALVVDDSALARKMFSGALTTAGIEEIDHAGDGIEALNKLKENQYSVISMDWNMPNMDGYQTLQQIRSLGITTPVIMVTGLADDNHVREAIKAGASNYLIKPYQPEKAVQIIQETLAHASSS